MFRAVRLVLIAGVILPTVSATAAGWGRHDVAKKPDSRPPASQTALRLARSQDGLDFVDTGEILIQGAASPDLILLRNDDLLALFDYAARPGETEPTVMAVSRSSDGGAAWSAMRPIRLKGGRSGTLKPRNGDLTRMPSGRLRLYFTADMPQNGTARPQGPQAATLIRSAVTRNGLEFLPEARARARLRGTNDARPMAVTFRRRVHLFVSRGSEAPREGKDNPAGVTHFISPKGKRFTQIKPTGVPEVTFIGSIIPLKRGLRAYVSSDVGIVSLVSRNGSAWRREAGTRLAAGWDPAVTKLRDGTFLMVYSAPLPPEGWADKQLVALDQDANALDEWPPEEAAGGEITLDEFAELDSSTDVEGVTVTEVDEAGETGARPLPTDADTGATGEGDAPDVPSADWRDTYDPIATNGFAPAPDFVTPVNYLDWYREFGVTKPVQNAFDIYRALAEDMEAIGTDGPEFHDRLNGGEDDGPPAPWTDEDHPAWAAASDAVQPLLDRFRDAAQMDGYSLEAQIDQLEQDSGDDVPLLLELRLPHLSAHRRLMKALIADSWRVGPDGKVSPERMLEAWRTIYRGAAHMDRGTTLIEELVGVAERALVQKNARWALKQGVFSEDELQTALDTLRDYDRRERTPQTTLRGEHAFSMQITQYLFPPNKRGEPTLDMKRARKIVDNTWMDTDTLDRFAEMTADDARATVEALNDHYRELSEQMAIGYPAVRSPDIDALQERYLHTSPVTETMLPGLSRYYQLNAREEASRRATQLAYATHIYKAKNGRFPTSLDELPDEFGQRMRTDPFTGGHFGYRLTDDGPRIYSLSENGLDDGGVHSPRWADNTEETGGSDDHVFYPPQKRR